MKLIDSTKKDLIELCKLRNIKNYSKLNKNELIILLKKNKKGGDAPCTIKYIPKNEFNAVGESIFTCNAQTYLKDYIEYLKTKKNKLNTKSIQLEENKYNFLYEKFNEDSKNNKNIITYGKCLSKYKYNIEWIHDVQYHYLKTYKHKDKIPICIPYKYIDFPKTRYDDAQTYLKNYIESKHSNNNSNNNNSIQLEENKHNFLYKKFYEDSNKNNNIITYSTCLSKYQYYIKGKYDVQYHYLKKYNKDKIPICIPYKYIDFAKTMVDDIFDVINKSKLLTYMTIQQNNITTTNTSKNANSNNTTSLLNTKNDLYIVFYKKTEEHHKKYNVSRGKSSGYVKALKININNLKNNKNVNEYKQTIIDDFNNNDIVTDTSYGEKCFNKEKYLRIIINNESYCIKKDNKYIIKIEQDDLNINQVVRKNKDNKYTVVGIEI
jgi:hypothetical protein